MSKLDHLRMEDVTGSRVKTFQKLMRFKIHEILLVSSLYDSYLFEEDGRLYELIRQEYEGLNLSQPPEIIHVNTGEEALDMAREEQRFDLIIVTLHIEDMHVITLARRLRESGVQTPIVLLAFDNRERKDLVTNFDTSIFTRIFLWQGDFRLLVAIFKLIEDQMNVENDTLTVGVQSILLVEDNVKFYSSYLPIIYTEILHQSLRLTSEGLSVAHRYLRMRARPKIILCTSYEEAWSFTERYEESILGIISDVNFLRSGMKDPEAGFRFATEVKARHEDIPILLQSSNPECHDRAREIGASFLLKGSPRLLHDLREFMMQNFGFGDFIFRSPDGREVGRASHLRGLQQQLTLVPDESILFHARRNHFSNWLKARTEFWLAHRLRPQKVEEFASVAELRRELITSLQTYQEARQRGVITEFSRDTFDPASSFARAGTGSLGGKARGLGFVNTLINTYNLRSRFEGIDITVPSTLVIATDIFDQFLDLNHLETFALASTDDAELNARFLDAPNFPREIVDTLVDYLDLVRAPLAVRSSSLLEDSQFQPFAGVYETFMLPNNHPDPAVRLEELLRAVKLVYASTFSINAKTYMRATAYRLEEEKMAVIIQRMVGSPHGTRFYPAFAGVAKSYNFYPVPPQKSTDGIVQVALGLGKTVVDGGNSIRFCPKYPRHLLQFFSTAETIRTAQQSFFALNLDPALHAGGMSHPELFLQEFTLAAAEEDDTLFFVGSTYSAENETVYDGVSREGKRVVTFAPILKHKVFPLPEIIDMILDMGTWGMGTHVEVEFAVTMHTDDSRPKEFAVLQIRPLVLSLEMEELDVEGLDASAMLCRSDHVLGNGAYTDLYDVVVVDSDRFDRSRSREAAAEVSALNARLVGQHRPYLLIGVGRWGSMDPWLGMPVAWDQIAGAQVIVEGGFKDFTVTPSQGSHFFQNITSFRVGYFTVNSYDESGFIDWEWLLRQPAVEEGKFVRHLRFANPIIVKINGHRGKGVILKPAGSGGNGQPR